MVDFSQWTRKSAPPVWPTSSPRTGPPGTPFPFFSLPRELRDQVYFHYLPHTLAYCQPTSKATVIWRLHAETDSSAQPHALHPYLSLFLVSRQFQLEAQEILFRATTISLPSCRRLPWSIKRFQHDERLPLQRTLAAFPSSQADLVTRVSREYLGDTDMYFGDADTDEAFGMWAHVVSESWIAQSCFPRLKIFEVSWQGFEKQITGRFWHLVAGLDPECVEAERKMKVEEVAGVFVGWLEGWVQDRGLVPPVWLRIGFEWNEQVLNADKYGMKVLEDGLALAHKLFAKKTLSGTEKVESGRQWLEGLSETRKRGRKGWCDAAVVT